MKRPLYSIRMHAILSGKHLSGAERLAAEEDLEKLAAALVRRAMVHPRGRADSIRITVEALARAEVVKGRLPDLRTISVPDFRQGREAARHFLIEAGVAVEAIEEIMATLVRGAASGGANMRGAMLVDARNGRRLEPDPDRGIRVSRMDLARPAEEKLRRRLDELGLNNSHVREALVLAAKVLLAPGIVAELCWSDDPDYTAGYVATPARGYIRFPHLKPRGEERGGRAFFLRSEEVSLETVIQFLERSVVLFEEIGQFHDESVWED